MKKRRNLEKQRASKVRVLLPLEIHYENTKKGAGAYTALEVHVPPTQVISSVRLICLGISV